MPIPLRLLPVSLIVAREAGIRQVEMAEAGIVQEAS